MSMYHWRQFSEEIINLIQSGVVLVDIDGNIAQMNQYAIFLLQINETSWNGRGVSELFPELDMNPIRQALSEKVTVRIDELKFRLPDEELVLSAEVSPLIVLGQTVGTIITFQDLTASIKLREDRVRTEKMATIGSMAAGTVHEIRNPLTTIKGFLQLFERDVQKMSGMGLVQKSFSDKSKNIFPLLFMEIHKIEQILNDFMLISQPQMGRYKVIRIHDFMNAVTPKLQEIALSHHVSIACEFPRQNRKFFGDPDELTVVLTNLVKNALESLDGQLYTGKIYLSVETSEDSVRFSVRDNGGGMSEELLKNAFEPFVTTKDDRPGLGLSICQQIVQRMSGKIMLSSEPGKGTVAEIEIPCLQDDVVNLEDMRPAYKEVSFR